MKSESGMSEPYVASVLPTSIIITVAPPAIRVSAAIAPVLPEPTTMNSELSVRSI
jgi:hypothetical protein